MSAFWGYLRSRRHILWYMAFVCVCFAGISALYGVAWDIIGYALLLALAGGLLFGLRGFARYFARQKTLERLIGRFPMGEMPEPEDSLEMAYQDIIDALELERARLQWAKESDKRDAEEYYTLWAHQVKTPIAALRLLLRDRRAEGTLRASDIEPELLRIEQYVSMVLQYQRLSSLQSDLQLREYSLDALTKQAVKSCAPLFIYKGLSCEVEELSGSIVTDQKWFVFVLEQVLTNAVKYTSKGLVRVYMQDASLVIADTGMGIPAEDLPRVFERGFTGAAGRSERSSTGIGLYLCREVLRRLGFGITLRSEPGKGTQAYIHLAQKPLPLHD